MQETLSKLKSALLPLYGKGEADAIIRIIFHYLKGWSLTDILIHQNDELSPYMKLKIDEILKRLLDYEPIQYITGEARFHGMELKVVPGVLIPRQETDELVDIIIDENKDREDLKILDICSGSGAIAIALARNLPFSKVSALDFSDIAVKVSQENADKLKTKIELFEADIFKWIPSGKYDIIVSNPPYVMDKEALTMEKNVLNYEPHEALFVRDDDPLVFYNRIADIAVQALFPDGKLYFEINPLNASNLQKLMAAKNFKDIRLLRDSYSRIRFLTCKLN